MSAAIRISEEKSEETAPPARYQWLRDLTGRSVFWITLVDIVILLLFGLISPHHSYVSLFNLQTLSLDAAAIVLVSVAEAMLLGSAQLDISVGANIILSSVLGAKACVSVSGSSSQVAAGEYPHLALGIAAGVIVALATGTVFGAINGVLVVYLRISALIATLATLGIGTGIAYVVTNGYNVANIPPALQAGFGSYLLFGVIPLPALVVAVLCALAWLTMAKTRFGLHTLACGSSKETATRAGIRVNKNTLALFMIMGFCGGVGGLIDFSRFATTDISGHSTDALAAIAGAVIGGTSLFGGLVSIGGAIMGALLAVFLEVGLIIMDLPSFYQQIAVGIVLIIAVSIDQFRARAKPT